MSHCFEKLEQKGEKKEHFTSNLFGFFSNSKLNVKNPFYKNVRVVMLIRRLWLELGRNKILSSPEPFLFLWLLQRFSIQQLVLAVFKASFATELQSMNLHSECWLVVMQMTVKKTLSNFRRTHHDNWQEHKQQFTDDQLLVLTDLLVSPCYYA